MPVSPYKILYSYVALVPAPSCIWQYKFVHKFAGTLDTAIIGASLSEPHINGTAMRELYIYMVRRSREIYTHHGSMGISAKYSIAHSHAWATGRIYAVLI